MSIVYEHIGMQSRAKLALVQISLGVNNFMFVSLILQ